MLQLTRNYSASSTAFFFFFATWALMYQSFAFWLEDTIGLSGGERGAVHSANAAMAMLVMPIYGYVQDQLGLKKNLLFAVGALLLVAGPFFIWVYGPLLKHLFLVGAVAGGLFAGLAFGAGVGALETYIDRCGRTFDFEFGHARVFGSIGSAIAGWGAGHVFNIDPNYNFLFACLAAGLFLIATSFIEEPASTSSQTNDTSDITLKTSLDLIRQREFATLVVYVVGVACVYSIYDQQFPNFFASFFETRDEGRARFADLHAIQIGIEALGLMVAPWIINKTGAKNGLLIAGVIMAVRIIGSGASTAPIEISLMKLLHAVELPILLVSLFKYIAAVFDENRTATVYIVGFQFTTQVMAAFFSVVAGSMYDELGFVTSYQVMGAAVSFFVVLSWCLLVNDKTLERTANTNFQKE